MNSFDYHEAFKRNLGLVTEDEQTQLKSKKIAIAGMGGVGGSHLLTLIRMGFENFHIADMDHFELANFNRQAGATMTHLGQAKAETMKNAALDINPRANITVFAEGIDEGNLDNFLKDVHVYVDGLDFFVLDIREKVFQKCREKNIVAITAGPIGVSTAYMIFNPRGMSFERYFRMANKDQIDKAAHFLVGLTPHLPQRYHFVDFSHVSLKDKKGSSLAAACMACSAVMGAEVLKICLNRGKIRYAPWAMQFDMYANRYHQVYNWFGNANPLNRIKINMLLRKVSGRHPTGSK